MDVDAVSSYLQEYKNARVVHLCLKGECDQKSIFGIVESAILSTLFLTSEHCNFKLQ